MANLFERVKWTVCWLRHHEQRRKCCKKIASMQPSVWNVLLRPAARANVCRADTTEKNSERTDKMFECNWLWVDILLDFANFQLNAAHPVNGFFCVARAGCFVVSDGEIRYKTHAIYQRFFFRSSRSQFSFGFFSPSWVFVWTFCFTHSVWQTTSFCLFGIWNLSVTEANCAALLSLHAGFSRTSILMLFFVITIHRRAQKKSSENCRVRQTSREDFKICFCHPTSQGIFSTGFTREIPKVSSLWITVSAVYLLKCLRHLSCHSLHK